MKTHELLAIRERSLDIHSSLSFLKPAITYSLTAVVGLFVSLYTICNEPSVIDTEDFKNVTRVGKYRRVHHSNFVNKSIS